MRKKSLMLIAFAFLTLPVFGQYDLSEVGVMAGGGFAPSLGDATVRSGPGGNVNAFFSHWHCGKNHGLQGSIGLRHFRATAQPGFRATPNGQDVDHPMDFTALDVGAYFKVRFHEYHRPKELSFLVGPKLNVLVNSGTSNGNGRQRIQTLAAEPRPISAGLHLSAWYKIKLNAQFLYLQPGFEYYPLPYMESTTGPVSNMYLFFNAGITLWNTKQKSFKRK
jgi:hypothetical protein